MEEWVNSMQEEMQFVQKNHTRHLVELLKGKQALKTIECTNLNLKRVAWDRGIRLKLF
jgi:hypothetical protein